MALLRGQRISVPAYCYPRYDYLSERADELINCFGGLKGSYIFRRYLEQGKEKLGSIIRNRKTLKSKLDLFVFYEKEDSDFLEINQFLVKNVDKEDKPEAVAILWEEVLELTKTTKDVDLSTAFIVVLSGEPSEVLKKVDDTDILRALPQQHTYFIIKDTKECCKMEDMFNKKPWRSNLGKLVESDLEKSVMDVVKQLEQFMAELLPGKRSPIQGNIMHFLRKRLKDWLGNEETKQYFLSITQSQGREGTSKTRDRELNTKFRRNMRISLTREAKRCVLDFVAQYHGLNQPFTNLFLLNNLKKAITAMPMPPFSNLKMSYKKGVKMVCIDCMYAITPLIESVESLVTNLMVILERMRRLQFVTHALLRLSPLTCNDIKEPPPLPKELQQDLLKKPFVTGCGTIYGELVIHVKSAINEQQKDDIECCLSLYGYLFPYKIEVCIPKCKKTAVKQGDLIVAKKISETNGVKKGSLGCFVDVKYTEKDDPEVHFITCHHCLEGCYNDVSVTTQTVSYKNIGSLKHFHREADIALVQVKKCDLISKMLLHVDGVSEIDRWQFFQEGYYTGRHVYKVGATSRITKGYIVSDNFQGNLENYADNLPPDSFLISPNNALNIEVGVQGDGAADELYFSYKGDSGSVVCGSLLESREVLVLGLLHGRFVGDVDFPEQSTYSYAIKMNSALNKLKDQYPEIESIEPSLDQDLPGAAAY